MANMSYCRFQNTLTDLKDCYNNMNKELSEDEELARKSLIDLCRQIASNYGDEQKEE